MESYYKHIQDYQQMIESLNVDIAGNNAMIMEKNIYNISWNYMMLTDKCIEYKRGRDIVNYRRMHEKTTVIHRYLSDYIESLNSSLFVTNSNNYRIIVNVLNKTEQLSISILILTFVLCAWMSAKIYKIGILMFGKKSTFKDLWKWLKMK